MVKQQDEPCYVTSVVARMLALHAQTLRYYERMGMIVPSRTRGNVRLYSEEDVQRLRNIKRLMDDLGVNLAGAEVILRMRDRIENLERQIARRDEEIARMRTARH